MMDQTPTTTSASTPTLLPRVTIRFCTQCKWMLRAAYYAQELLSTFSTSLGEVALQPSTGGTFVVDITYAATTLDNQASTTREIQQKTIWDRKTDGGFPETKELKRRVRDVIQPERNLGHVDRDYYSKKQQQQQQQPATEATTMEATRTKSTEAAAPPQQSTSNKTECADCDNWMTEETYKGGDFEGGHAGGSGRQSGEQSKTTGEGTGTGTDTRGGSGEKKTADSSWMTEETYKDLEGGQ
ncbi:Rdx family-domain-containing protein [Neurospora hispaniola]|uniref:Rdx family-domain-containing protein n=1 Tax=Neurospora hispaniola TaxID=588809 RepID=A0AAJ0MSK6_9PEZI|nr:Rdx family-domain-containing protein [Neurospora hispaniola]